MATPGSSPERPVPGDIIVDVDNRRVTQRGVQIALSGKPLDLFIYFASNADRLLTKSDIEQAVWGGRASDDTIYQHIRTVRNALEKPDIIINIRGEGYRLNAPVAILKPEPPITSAVEVPSVRRYALPSWRATAISSLLGLAVLVLILVSAPFHAHLGPAVPITHSRRAKQSPLVTDGRTIYFTETEAGHYYAVRQQLDGGKEEVLSVAVPDPYVCDLSRDGQQLLLRGVVGEFDDLGPFFAASLPDGQSRRLDALVGFDGKWSPSGDFIAISHDHDLLLAAPDGSRVRTLASVPGLIWWPRWSLDGKRIRFTQNAPRTQVRSLWEVSVDHPVLHTVFSDSAHRLTSDCCGFWTSDARFYLFQTSLQGELELWAIPKRRWWQSSDSEPIPLAAGFRGPTADRGTKKIFARGTIPNVEAVEVDVRTGDHHALFPDINGFFDISPDRQWLAISTFPENRFLAAAPKAGLCNRRSMISPTFALTA